MKYKYRLNKRGVLGIIGIGSLIIVASVIGYQVFSNNNKIDESDNKVNDSISFVELIPSTPIETEEEEEVNKDISLEDVKSIFKEKHAMVVGDSMAEGLSAYNVLDDESVVWTRGRRIDNMKEDMPKVISYQPKYLFLSYGENDLELWNGRSELFIKSYQETIDYIRSVLPDTTIIINSVLPVSESTQQKNPAFKYQELFNTELSKMADNLGIPFLENGNYLLEHDDPYTTDGIHPKTFYFYEWGKHMASFLNSVKV